MKGGQEGINGGRNKVVSELRHKTEKEKDYYYYYFILLLFSCLQQIYRTLTTIIKRSEKKYEKTGHCIDIRTCRKPCTHTDTSIHIHIKHVLQNSRIKAERIRENKF